MAVLGREAFGVRATCCRFGLSRTDESGSKLHALQTLRGHVIAIAPYLSGFTAVGTNHTKTLAAVQPSFDGPVFQDEIGAPSHGLRGEH